jgi:MFS family permease
MTGDQLLFVALPWVVLAITHSALTMSQVLVAGAVPRALLIAVGGVMSDRTSPRKIMICTALLRALLLFAIGALLGLHLVRMWHFYLFAFLFGTADAFSLPATETYLPYLVSGDELLHASALLGSTGSILSILGGPVGGLLLSVLHAPWAFVLDGVTFLPAALLLRSMPDVPKSAASPGNSVRGAVIDGFAYIRKHSELGSLILLSMLFNFCFEGPITVGIPYLTSHVLHSLPAFTALLSSSAAGALLGSLLIPSVAHWRPKLLFWGGSTLAGTCLCLLGVFRSLPILCGLILMVSFTVAGLALRVTTWVQQYVAPEMRGRIMSFMMLASLGLAPLSIALAGPLAEHSVRTMFSLAGGGLLIAGVLSTRVRIPTTQVPVSAEC